MKTLAVLMAAAAIVGVSAVPASAARYYYHGRYYPYRYHGSYYNYHYRGSYYRYHYHGHYYNGRNCYVRHGQTVCTYR